MTRFVVAPAQLATWMQHYGINLMFAVQEHPDEYYYPETEVPKVAEKMRAAFERGSFNLDGYAIKRTCKDLGIKHTRTAIVAFLTGAVAS